MYRGAVFFDYDGTLADEANEIFLPTKETMRTVKKLREDGYAIFLATGRSKCYIPDVPDMFDGYVAANGAYFEINGEVISSHLLDEEIVGELASEFERMNLEYSFESQEALYVRNVKSESFIDMLNVFKIPLDIMKPYDEKNNVCKGIVIFNNDEEFNYLKLRFSDRAVFDRHRTYNSSDVSVFGVNKGVGVREVIETLKIPYENTYAFGDGTNDVEMIKAVRHGVAMGECVQAARDAAEYVTDTVINEGITKAFIYYGCI